MALLARRVNRLDEVAGDLRDAAVAIAADVTDRDSLVEAAERIQHELGGADWLVARHLQRGRVGRRAAAARIRRQEARLSGPDTETGQSNGLGTAGKPVNGRPFEAEGQTGGLPG